MKKINAFSERWPAEVFGLGFSIFGVELGSLGSRFGARIGSEKESHTSINMSAAQNCFCNFRVLFFFDRRGCNILYHVQLNTMISGIH